MANRDDEWMAAGSCVNLPEADAMFCFSSGRDAEKSSQDAKPGGGGGNS